MKGTRAKRRSGGSKPVDLSRARDLFGDRRTWVAHGIVVKPEGEEHFEIDGEDVMIEVKLVDTGIPVFARLGVLCGAPGVGIYMVPPVGAEVLVAFPKGEIDGDPVIFSTLSTGQLPDGVANNGTIVIAVKPGANVLIHDGDSGECKALATADHKHPLPAMQVVTTAAAGTWSVAPVAGDLVTDTPDDVTTTLKSK